MKRKDITGIDVDAVTGMRKELERMADPMGLSKLSKALEPPDLGCKALAVLEPNDFGVSKFDKLFPRFDVPNIGRKGLSDFCSKDIISALDRQLLKGVSPGLAAVDSQRNLVGHLGLNTLNARALDSIGRNLGLGATLVSLHEAVHRSGSGAAQGALLSSMRPFMSALERLREFDGAIGVRWDALAPKAFNMAIHLGSMPSLVVLDREDFLAALTWTESAGEQETPVAKVIPITRQKPAGDRIRQLKIHADSNLFCSVCFRQFEWNPSVTVHLIDDEEALIDHPVIPFTTRCPDCEAEDYSDIVDDPTHVIVSGDEENVPESGRYLIVSLDRDDDGDDDTEGDGGDSI